MAKVTAHLKGRFLAQLCTTGNVSHAAQTVGLSRRHMYRVRAADAAFAADWDEAVAEYVDGLEAEADRRAVQGVTRPILYKGQVVHTVQEYSDVLLALQERTPENLR